MSEELKPCPFCGGKPKLEKFRWTGIEYSIICTECGCRTFESNNYNAVIKAWNTRKPVDKCVERMIKEKRMKSSRDVISHSIWHKAISIISEELHNENYDKLVR